MQFILKSASLYIKAGQIQKKLSFTNYKTTARQ